MNIKVTGKIEKSVEINPLDVIRELKLQLLGRNDYFIGEDEQVLVKVLNDERNQDQTGGFSKSVVEVLTKQYQIQNLHQQAIDLLVFESVPKSQNDALKVSYQFSENPVATQWQGQDNIYQWRPQLAPNQTWQLNIQYQFKYPKDGYATGF